MKVKRSLGSRIRGWFPQDPKMGVTKSTNNGSNIGHFVLGKNAVPILAGLLSASLVALLFAAFQRYELAVSGAIAAGLSTGLNIHKARRKQSSSKDGENSSSNLTKQ